MEEFLMENVWILLLITLWVAPWKGVALWKSARNRQMSWFIALLILNTLAILPITYIFFFSKPRREISTGFFKKSQNNKTGQDDRT